MASTTHTYTILTGAQSVSGSIRNWAVKGDIPVEQILAEAQAKIWNGIRLQQMITESTVMLAVGDDHFDAPTNLVSPLELWLDLYGEIPYIHEAGRKRFREEDSELYEGIPTRFTWAGDELQFDVKCDQVLSARFTYYASLPALSGANETNILTDRFPTLLRRACLAYAYEHMKQIDAHLTQMKLVEAAIEEANSVSDRARFGQVMR